MFSLTNSPWAAFNRLVSAALVTVVADMKVAFRERAGDRLHDPLAPRGDDLRRRQGSATRHRFAPLARSSAVPATAGPQFGGSPRMTSSTATCAFPRPSFFLPDRTS